MVEGSGLFEEVTLYIKWFNVIKGYGFAVSEQIPEDIFVHFSLVQAAGKSNLNTGDKIICNIAKVQNRYQVMKIISIEDHKESSQNILNKKQILATIKWFNQAKGYGFANDPEGNDIFLHKNIIPSEDIEISQLLPGKKILLDVIKTAKGLEAIKCLKNDATEIN